MAPTRTLLCMGTIGLAMSVAACSDTRIHVAWNKPADPKPTRFVTPPQDPAADFSPDEVSQSAGGQTATIEATPLPPAKTQGVASASTSAPSPVAAGAPMPLNPAATPAAVATTPATTIAGSGSATPAPGAAPAPVIVVAGSAVSPAAPASPPPPPAKPVHVFSWSEDEDLPDIFLRWAQQEGLKPTINTRAHWPMLTAHSETATFDEALADLLRGASHENPIPVVDIAPNGTIFLRSVVK